MKTRFYFALCDSDELLKYPFRAKMLNKTFKDWFKTWSYDLPDNFNFDSKTTTLFQDYIWPKFYNEIFFFVDVEHDPWTEPEKPAINREISCDKLGCIYSWLIESQERYGKLIDLYEAQQNNLMNKISASSKTLFNDTPQNGGDFTTDNHITNATQVTSESDVGTPIARLKEIRDNLESLYSSWANEFRKFIIFR